MYSCDGMKTCKARGSSFLAQPLFLMRPFSCSSCHLLLLQPRSLGAEQRLSRCQGLICTVIMAPDFQCLPCCFCGNEVHLSRRSLAGTSSKGCQPFVNGATFHGSGKGSRGFPAWQKDCLLLAWLMARQQSLLCRA